MNKNKEEGNEDLVKSSSSKAKSKVESDESAPSYDLNSLIQKFDENEKLMQKVLGKIKNLDDKMKDFSSFLEQQEKIFYQIDCLDMMAEDGLRWKTMCV